MKSHSIAVRMLGLGMLLEGVDRGEVALPDFQREFEWSSSDIEQMLVTAINAWPAGSLLLLEGDDESYFKLKGFSGGPQKLANRPRYIVLDGQQRITALYHAIFGRGDRVYYVDGNSLLETGELEDAVRAVSRGKWKKSFSSPGSQAESLFVPCSALRSPTSFFEWRDDAVDQLQQYDAAVRKRALTEIYQRHLSPLHSYEFPAVVLERNTTAVAVARIFERVNRLGLRLNTFDLMVARTYSHDWNLREKWKAFSVESPEAFEFMERDGLAALQVIAVTYEGDVRQAAILRLNASQVHGAWDSALAGLRASRDYLADTFCCESRGSLPYASISTLIAALASDGIEVGSLEGLDAFVLAKSFDRAYDVASNTRVVADFKRIKRSARITEDLRRAEVSAEDLILAGNQGGKAISAALMLMVKMEFAVCSPTSAMVELASVGIFPAHFEANAPGLPAPSSRVLSTVYLPRSEALVVQREGFVRWLEGAPHADTLLAANFLPAAKEILRLDLENDWSSLLAQRASGVLARLKARGVLVSLDS